MKNITLDHMKAQLDATKGELEHLKGLVHRCEGVITLLEHFIKEEEDTKTPEVVDALVVGE